MAGSRPQGPSDGEGEAKGPNFTIFGDQDGSTAALVVAGLAPRQRQAARAEGWLVIRQIGPQTQTIWLEFESGVETYIEIRFITREPLPSGADWLVCGLARDPPVRIALWKRFTWSHLRDLTRPQPEPDDLIQAAIDKAKTDILAIDAFLKGGEPHPRVGIRSAREVWTEI